MQNKFKKAFTLIELLIVIAIIAILTVAFLPGALKAPARARDAGKIKKVQDIVAAVEAYNAQKMSYPTSNSTNCLTDAEISLMNIDLPKDSTGLNSCGSTNAADKDKFLYKATSSFYAIGVLMETKNAANAVITSTVIGQSTSKPTFAAPGANDNDPTKWYYLVVGP